MLVEACKCNIQIGLLLPAQCHQNITACTNTACTYTASYVRILHLFQWKSQKFSKLANKLTVGVWHYQSNSTSSFIPSLSFSARKQVKSRFTLTLKQALSACLTRVIFLYFAATIFFTLNASSCYVLSSPNFTCVLSFTGRNAPTPCPETPKHQNTGRGQLLCRHSHPPDMSRGP